MSKKLARRLELKIDTSNSPFLKEVATDAESYGWCYNVSITFTNKLLSQDTNFTMPYNIIVSNYNKYALIIGTDWLDLAEEKMDYEKRKFRVCNTVVPISVHRLSISHSGTI
jgi:hypothetical protein